MVTTICYGKEEQWNTREEAMAEFKDCMFNSEGAEHERYEKIYWELDAGYEVASDIEWCYSFDSLTTVAKVRCLERFVDIVCPTGWNEINDGNIDDLIENVKIWFDGDQFTIDYEGNWYYEGRKL